jgi:glycosyltransferase involved in cell wall biosynthesis
MYAPNSLAARVFHLAERLLAPASHTITCSESEAAFGRERIGLPHGRHSVVPNGVDCTTFRPAAPEGKQRIRESYGIPPGARVLGTVGRYSQQKDPRTLYEALSLAKAHRPELFFVHLGKGELEPEIERLLEARQMSGWVRRLPFLSETAPFYQALDGFILTSRSEGLPYALLEAMGANLPLILSRCPGILDLEQRGLSHSYWSAPGEAATFAEQIGAWSAALDSSPTSPNHRQIAMAHFSEEACFASVLELYERERGKLRP